MKIKFAVYTISAMILILIFILLLITSHIYAPKWQWIVSGITIIIIIVTFIRFRMKTIRLLAIFYSAILMGNLVRVSLFSYTDNVMSWLMIYIIVTYGTLLGIKFTMDKAIRALSHQSGSS